MAERIHAGDFDSKVLADGTFALVDFYSDKIGRASCRERV